jgi:hypothetical protein
MMVTRRSREARDRDSVVSDLPLSLFHTWRRASPVGDAVEDSVVDDGPSESVLGMLRMTSCHCASAISPVLRLRQLSL